MKFFTLFFLAVAVAAVAFPSPEVVAPDFESAELLAGVKGLPGKTIVCAKNRFTAKQIRNVANATLRHISNKSIKTSDTGVSYPHRYNYKDPHVKLSKSCKKGDELYEFPIESHGVWRGGSVRHIPDRIVLKGKLGKKDATYCGLITHTGATGNGFKSCSG
ncbi:hypothetical protein VTO42DRAFT_1553 [Malbranchea cinnamomea]